MSTVEKIMTENVLTVFSDWSLECLSRFFFDNHVSGAPVVDSGGKLVGVVSVTDLAHNKALSIQHSATDHVHEYYVRGILEHKFSPEDTAAFQYDVDDTICVGDIMTPMIFELDQNASVKQAAEIMLKGRIHRIFITDHKKIVGVVSAMDMLKVIKDSPTIELTEIA